jgi:pyrroline-5-carboxylate reductase
MAIGGEPLLLVGAGKMGGALLQGWLERGFDAARINVLEPDPSPQIKAFAARGVVLAMPAAPPSVIVLAIKPQMLDAVAPALAPLTSEATLIISILAGKTRSCAPCPICRRRSAAESPRRLPLRR